MLVLPERHHDRVAVGDVLGGGHRRQTEDRDGELLWEPVTPPSPALPPGLAWIVTDMLREVVDRGTAYNVRNPAVGNLSYDIPAAGKTGTSEEYADAWFAGFTPQMAAVKDHSKVMLASTPVPGSDSHR